MNIKLSLLITLLLILNLFGQSNKIIDSLNQTITNDEVHDTIKITNYISLSGEFYTRQPDSSMYYVKKALKLSLANNNYKIAKVYVNLGILQSDKLNRDSARFYYEKALKFLGNNNNKIERSIVYGNYSKTYERTNNLDKELEYSLKAIKLVKDNHKELCFLYLNHSIIYDDSGFKKQGKKYLKLAYLSSKKSKEYRVQAISLSQLADDCIDEKKYDSAAFYLKKGDRLCKKIKSPEINFYINAIYGKLYDELKMFNKAYKAHNITLKSAKTLKSLDKIMIANFLLAKHEYKKGNFKKAIKFFNDFEKNYKKVNDFHIGILAYKVWAKAEMELKNYKKSNLLMQKYISIQDSIYFLKNRNMIANADVKYQTEKKDKELLQQKIQIQQQKRRFNYMTGIILFLLVSSILTWYLFKQKQKRKNEEIVTLKRMHQIKTLESLIEGEEKERFRIAKELHDGVNGDLSAIKYKLSSFLEMNNKIIKEVVVMIDNSCRQVRAISHNLVPPSLEKFNLLEVTQEYCHNMDVSNATKINFQHIGESLKMTKKSQVNIYRIVQELITNSLKHANATEINIQMSCRNKTLQITVEDNGKGFDKENIKGNGIGLSNIQSRIDYLHAEIDILSNKKGTSTTIEIDTDILDDN